MKFLEAFARTAEALDDADKTDELCCVFAKDLTRELYGDEVIARAPIGLWHLFPELGDPWGPVTAVVRAQRAESSSYPTAAYPHPPLTVGRWHRVQGWRGTPFAPKVSGHTITVAALSASSALVLDAAAGRGHRGEGCAFVDWRRYSAQFTGGYAVAVLMRP